MITAASLRERTSKDLAQMAKKKGVSGWHSMKKEQLISALVRLAKKKGPVGPATAKSRSVKSRRSPNEGKATHPKILEKIRRQHQRDESFRDLSEAPVDKLGKREINKDRMVLLVRDPYWLHVYWEVTKATIRRAQVSMGQKWHDARPTLRILKVSEDGTNNSIDDVYRDISIHGGVNNWYVNVENPPGSFRAALGYRCSDDRFHLVCKSNTVATPQPNTAQALSTHWLDVANDYERIYSLSGGTGEGDSGDLRDVFEEKLRRPMSAPVFARFGAGINPGNDSFNFDVDAEMIIHGSTDPKAIVTMAGEPVKLRPDGSFAVSMPIPDRRQVIPIVASSRDGSQQRTTVMAIERNTKVMEPVNCEMDDV